MSGTTTTTYTCDRCGATAQGTPPTTNKHALAPRTWVRLNGHDLCPDCKAALDEWLTTGPGTPAPAFELAHSYLDLARCPQSLGDAMRLIGRYTESEGGRSAETMQARADLFDAYETWCHLDRPETEPTKLTPALRARFEAAAERGLAANREIPEGGGGR